VPETERDHRRFERIPETTEAPRVQGFSPMELAGLEPAASWVRSRRSGVADTAALQGLMVVPARRSWLGIAAGICRFSSFQALLTMSA
jgi:hypothetical protein